MENHPSLPLEITLPLILTILLLPATIVLGADNTSTSSPAAASKISLELDLSALKLLASESLKTRGIRTKTPLGSRGESSRHQSIFGTLRNVAAASEEIASFAAAPQDLCIGVA